ncbi:MAG: thiamine pyrophosphate-binding protein [Parvibaculaceae bacterium]|nr:thiamine pyrophosphate-binding protein [Parvibaculaceae bacterium]
MSINGGHLAAKTLAKAGVKVVFALHGGHLDTFLKGCKDEGIHLIDCRHEAAAVNAADGYARLTGKLGVAAVTSGPGLTNGLAGITNAAADCVPILVITSSSPIRETETLELQGGLDLMAMINPVTKWSRKVLDASRVADLVGLAIRHALSAPAGPAVVDIPIDVAFTSIEDDGIPNSGEPVLAPASIPQQTCLNEAADLIKAAKRPIAIVGEASLTSDLSIPLKDFAERAHIPIYSSPIARSGLPADHPQGAGGMQFIPLIGETPDLVVLIGARQGMFTGGRGGMIIPPNAKVIQMSEDPVEIGRLYPVDVAVVGSINEGLTSIAQAKNFKPRKEWCEKATAVKEAPSFLFPDAGQEEDGIHPHRIATEVLTKVTAETILILDGGEAAVWLDWPAGAVNHYAKLNLGYQGHLGIGQGFAIGAQQAHPDKRVIQVVGDGAIAFHIQEWDTMVRHNLPIITVIFNNACWGMSIHGQHAVNGKGQDIISKLNPTAYEKVGDDLAPTANMSKALKK